MPDFDFDAFNHDNYDENGQPYNENGHTYQHHGNGQEQIMADVTTSEDSMTTDVIEERIPEVVAEAPAAETVNLSSEEVDKW